MTTRGLVFTTPGTLDLRAITVMGMSAKPNSAAPLGFFGTGLKHALAGCVRLGAEPIIWIGNARHRLLRREVEFRGQTFDLLALEHVRFAFAPNFVTELPFTTELGRTWEPWQLYRELESNTRDEGGTTAIVEDVDAVDGEVDTTKIVVPGDLLAACHEDRDRTFLPDALTPIGVSDTVQVFDCPSDHLYYRGLRVLDLGAKPALFTYNLIGHQELTEDRTLKHAWSARAAIARYVAASDDERSIARMLGAAPSAWEHDLDFDYAHVEPSATFKRAAARRASRSATRLVARYEPPPLKPRATTWDRHPRPWRVADGTNPQDRVADRIVDDHGLVVLSSVGSDVDVNERPGLLAAVVRAVNRGIETADTDDLTPF